VPSAPTRCPHCNAPRIAYNDLYSCGTWAGEGDAALVEEGRTKACFANESEIYKLALRSAAERYPTDVCPFEQEHWENCPHEKGPGRCTHVRSECWLQWELGCAVDEFWEEERAD